MDPNLLLALLGLFGQGGNSLFGGYGSTPQNTNYGNTGSSLLDLLFSLGLFQNANDQSLGGNLYGGAGTQNTQQSSDNLASLLFQWLFGPQAQQQAVNYQQTQPQTQWYNPNNPNQTSIANQNAPTGTTQQNMTAGGAYQSPYGPAVAQSTQHPAFTGYATPTQQGSGYSPYKGPGGYIEVNGQPTWAPGTGALGGVTGGGPMTRLGLPAGTQTPTNWGPMTLDAGGTWSKPGNLPNLSTEAHGLYDDVPTMVGADGTIYYNPGAANGQPFDHTRGWVTWDQMDDITTALYQKQGLPLPAELAAANAARAAGHMPDQRAQWAKSGFPGYVAPGTIVPYHPSPGYTPPAAATAAATAPTNMGSTLPPASAGAAPTTAPGAMPSYLQGYSPTSWQGPAGAAQTGTYGSGVGGAPAYHGPLGAVEGNAPITATGATGGYQGTTGPTRRLVPNASGGYGSVAWNAPVTTNTVGEGHSLSPGIVAQGGTPPVSKSGVAPWWDAGIGKWYDAKTNTYY